MSNPVMAALAAARLRQISSRDDEMAAAVRKVIGPVPYDNSPPSELWRSWSQEKGTSELPAATSAVALFVLEHAGLGIEPLLEHVRGISALHTNSNLSDPTSSFVVTASLNTTTKIEPPHSWPKAEKARFLELPYTLQAYVAKREKDQRREISRAQMEAGELRRQLAEIQKQETTNETQTVNA
jgi:hypothetical protein